MNKEIIYLLHKHEFKQWVLEPSRESDLYWKKWLEKNPGQRKNVIKAREIILRMRFRSKDLKENEIDQILNKIISSEKTQTKTIPSHNKKRRFLLPKIAAAVILLLTFGLLFYQYENTKDENPGQSLIAAENVIKENPKGAKSQFHLPDGSKVTLNAESKLIFPDQFSDSVRVVELTGEAFFEIEKDEKRSFIVKAADHSISVLGTKFNVNAYPESNLDIALVEGKVMVKKEKQNALKHTLKPGQKFHFNKHNNIEKITSFNPVSEIGWKDGILVLTNAGFNTFLKKLEKWYGVEFIVYGSIDKEWNVDGTFDNESLEEILRGVSFTHNIDYEIKDDKVMIHLD